jgi:hypothetical protein
MNLYLGLVYQKGFDGKYELINHRSILKILLNPILRKFGYFINTVYDKIEDKVKGLEILKLKKDSPISIFEQYGKAILYPFDPECMILKRKRILF